MGGFVTQHSRLPTGYTANQTPDFSKRNPDGTVPYTVNSVSGPAGSISGANINAIAGRNTTDYNGMNALAPGSFGYNNFDLIVKNQNALAGGDYSKYQQDVFNRQYLADPLTAQADPSKQWMNGDPRFAAAQQAMLQNQSANAMGRAAPTINTAGMQPWQMGAQDQINNAYTAGNLGLQQGGLQNQQGYRLNDVATGAGYQGQMGAAGGLMNLAQMPAGESVAEQAMRMQAGANERSQAALAAGARGGNSALALNNAAANAAGVGGQLQQQLGMQRAQEDLANRQFAANAYGAAGNMYGNAAGTQLGAYGGANSAFNGAGSTFNNAGGLYATTAGLNLQGAGQMAGIATANANNQLNQTQLNQQYGLGSQQLGADYMKSQLNAQLQADANRTQNATNLKAGAFANRDRTGEGTITGSGGGDKALGAGASALGAMIPLSDIRAKSDVKPASVDVSNAFRQVGQAFAPTVSGVVQPRGQMVMPQVQQQIDYSGPPAPNAPDVRMALAQHPLVNGLASKEAIWPGSRSALYGMGTDMNASPAVTFGTNGISDDPYSDIRAKRDIHPAQSAVDNAFRAANADAAAINGTTVQYPMSVGRMPDASAPAYSYQYKNPSAVGAAPGVHYGPMAQDLEKTPAGASVVVQKPNGMKGIDTGRLSLLNTSELAKQRAELDALKRGASAISAPVVQYPQPTLGYGY